MESNLDKIRTEIDATDKQLIALFVHRMQLCSQVAEYKKENKLPLFHPAREQEVIQNAILLGAPFGKETGALLEKIMALSKEVQQSILEPAQK